MNKLLISAVFIITFINNFSAECSKILGVFGAPCISHQVVFHRLCEELRKRGHELVVITPLPQYPDKAKENLTEINIFDVSHDAWQRMIKTISSDSKRDLNQQKKLIASLVTNLGIAQVTTKKVQQLINDKSNKFDLIIIESGCNSLMVFSHIFKAPTILMSSLGANFGNFEVFGGTVHPILYPSGMCRRFYNLTVWDKFNEIYDFYWYKYITMHIELEENRKLKTHLDENTPTVYEMSNNLDSLFLNIHRVLEGNRPVPPSVLYLGGMHQLPEKELDQDLKSYLDISKNGVIYMSFGTNVIPSLFASEKLQIFVNVFSKLPYDIIWKWDEDDIPGRSDNVKVMKWVPQADLLRHPKIKLFITQGGLQSTDESITAGVPFIGIPMLGDQWFTTEKYVQHKIGIKLDFDTLTEEKLKESIETVIGDKSYRENVVKLRNIMYDQPQTSLERAVWWTEYVLRHGGAKHLRGPAANISLAEYLELNLILNLLIVLFIVTSLVMYGTYLLFRSIRKFVVLKLRNIKLSN